MLHEIIDNDEEYADLSALDDKSSSDNNNGESLIKHNQRLEVVKITKCKMRAKDTLEVEIGLKNLNTHATQFEERKFILRFLNKLDPALTCKGRLHFNGNDILKL